MAMVCSFRGPSSRILWQRWLCTCCTRPSLPYSTAAFWLIVALLPPELISKYRSKITKQQRRVNTTLLNLDYPSFLGPSAYFIASATIKKYRSRISRKSPSQKSRLPSPTNYDISFNNRLAARCRFCENARFVFLMINAEISPERATPINLSIDAPTVCSTHALLLSYPETRHSRLVSIYRRPTVPIRVPST